MSDETYRRMNAIMWNSALKRAQEERPDYRFYLPFGAGDGRELPSELIGVSEHPSQAVPQLPAVHLSYFKWPQRQTFSHEHAPISAAEVAERCGTTISCEEKVDKNDDVPDITWRAVTLTTADGRALRESWDMAMDEHPFERTWPPTAAQVLDKLAREVVDIDDGRTDKEWLELQTPDHRGQLEKVQRWHEEHDKREDFIAGTLRRRRIDAWELYRLLGADLYEGLTAGYREPLAAALFAAGDADERARARNVQLKALGKRLRAARRELGLSVEKTAEFTGLAKARVQGAERGSGTLKLTELLILSELYRIPVDELVADMNTADAGSGTPDMKRRGDSV